MGDDAGLPFFQLQATAMLEVFDHVWCLCESSMLSGQNEGNLVLVGTARELDEDTQDWLYALGPHPAEVLTTVSCATCWTSWRRAKPDMQNR